MLSLFFDFLPVFRALPVTGSDRNLYQATISTFVYALKKKVWVNILPGAAVMERPDFLNWKKNSS